MHSHFKASFFLLLLVAISSAATWNQSAAVRQRPQFLGTGSCNEQNADSMLGLVNHNIDIRAPFVSFEVYEDVGTPPEPTVWDTSTAEALLDDLDTLLEQTVAGELLNSALRDITNPRLTKDMRRRAFWDPYAKGTKTMREFFSEWLHYTPYPEDETLGDQGLPNGPGLYMIHWDYLANTIPGLYLTNAQHPFKDWFVRFLDLHADWVNSLESNATIPLWLAHEGSRRHPFNISDFLIPKGGYRTFNQFFLREINDLPRNRPMDDDPRAIVSPNDGSIFFLQDSATLPDKFGDRYEVNQTFQKYGDVFVGGTLLDSLLWFTDYHHFRAPISGEVVHMCEWQGSYNYDLDNFDPTDPYYPGNPPNSNRAGWYKSMPTHKRFNWVIKADVAELGYVGMSAIGFWEVGSIHNLVSSVGYHVNKGERMGHFEYGGSSIVLAFQPNVPPIAWAVGGDEIRDADHPTIVRTRQTIGTIKVESSEKDEFIKY